MSESKPHLDEMLLFLQEQYPNLPTVTAIALATFRLFVETDIKTVISELDIIEGANQVLAQTDLAPYTDEIDA